MCRTELQSCRLNPLRIETGLDQSPRSLRGSLLTAAKYTNWRREGSFKQDTLSYSTITDSVFSDLELRGVGMSGRSAMGRKLDEQRLEDLRSRQEHLPEPKTLRGILHLEQLCRHTHRAFYRRIFCRYPRSELLWQEGKRQGDCGSRERCYVAWHARPDELLLLIPLQIFIILALSTHVQG